MEYCITGMLCLALRAGALEMQWGKDQAKATAHALLLQKRVVNHMAKEFPLADVSDCAYTAGRKPSEFYALLRSWATFHTAFPRGRRLLDPLQPFAATGAANEGGAGNSTAFSASYPLPYIKVVDFLLDVMEMRGTAGAWLERCGRERPGIASADFMKIAAVRGAFDASKVMAEFEALRSAALPPPCAEAPLEDDDHGDEDADMPNRNPLGEASSNSSWFKALRLDQAVANRFDSVDPERFQGMVAEAERYFRYVEWFARPSDGDYGTALRRSSLFVSRPSGSRVWFSLDDKGLMNLPSRVKKDQWQIPAHDPADTANILEALLGKATAKAADRRAQRIFGERGGSDIITMASGRSLHAHLKQKSAAVKFTRGSKDFSKKHMAASLRVVYTNEEFDEQGMYATTAATKHGGEIARVPRASPQLFVDTLDSHIIIARSDFEYPSKQRVLVNQGSSTRNLCMFGAPLRLPSDIDCSIDVQLKAAIATESAATMAKAGHAADSAEADAADDGESDASQEEADETGELENGSCEPDDHGAARSARTCVHRLFPWAAPECVLRELDRQLEPTSYVFFHGGSGAEAVMASRLRKRAVVFVSPAAIPFCKEHLVATIVDERLRGTDDGFMTRRFVQQENSLGGGEGGPTADEVETPMRDRKLLQALPSTAAASVADDASSVGGFGAFTDGVGLDTSVHDIDDEHVAEGHSQAH